MEKVSVFLVVGVARKLGMSRPSEVQSYPDTLTKLLRHGVTLGPAQANHRATSHVEVSLATNSQAKISGTLELQHHASWKTSPLLALFLLFLTITDVCLYSYCGMLDHDLNSRMNAALGRSSNI